MWFISSRFLFLSVHGMPLLTLLKMEREIRKHIGVGLTLPVISHIVVQPQKCVWYKIIISWQERLTAVSLGSQLTCSVLNLPPLCTWAPLSVLGLDGCSYSESVSGTGGLLYFAGEFLPGLCWILAASWLITPCSCLQISDWWEFQCLQWWLKANGSSRRPQGRPDQRKVHLSPGPWWRK